MKNADPAGIATRRIAGLNLHEIGLDVRSVIGRCGGIEDVGHGVIWDAVALGDQVNRRAAVLSQMGIGRGSVVAIGHGGTARFFADLFATWSLGAAAACLDPTLTPGELRTVVAFARSAVLLVDGVASVDDLPVPIVDLGRMSPSRDVSIGAPSHDPDDPALVLFTSGTTGAPKGVVLSFRTLQARIDANIAAIGTPALARALVSLPTHFGHGLIGNSLTPLLAGGDIVLHRLGISMANDLGRIIDQHDITFMSSVPALWRLALTRSPRPTGGSLVRVHVGSAPFPAALWSEVVAWSGTEVVNCYGTTETANWIAGASSRADGIADGLLGKMWGGSAAIMDERGSIRHTGAGEIMIQSPSLMSGYLDRPDLTEDALHQGWFRTGDRGSIDQQGRLWLTGRIKDEINRAGFKVQPAEIDALLESNPAIVEACVFGVSDPLGGEAIAAAIRLKNGASPSSKNLQAWCLERVRREAVPEHWFVVSEIPRTARGKVSRDAVRRMLVKETVVDARNSDLPAPALADEAPASAAARNIRTAVESAWTEILGYDSYLADLPLIEAGGDSFDALRLWLLIEKIVGERLSMEVLTLGSTPGQLTAALDQQLWALSGRSALHVPSAKAPLVFLMTPAQGDLPGLARFRAECKDDIRFAVIEYPSWREMIEAGGGFNVLVDAAVAQICALSRENDLCLLAGYSFGGLVAVETARRLVERGRRIDFLGLIDTQAVMPSAPRKRRQSIVSASARRLMEWGRRINFPGLVDTQAAMPAAPQITWQNIISALISRSAFRTLRIIGRLGALLPAKHAITIEYVMNERLRIESLRGLRLKPLQVPVTLYRSGEGYSTLLDNGWGAYCSRVAVTPIGGTHHSMWEPPFLEILCARFLEDACRVKMLANLRAV
jgi:oxalate---CoA ligase